jgi:hypothetical protein
MRARLTLCFSVCLALASIASVAATARAQDNLDRVQVGVPGTVTRNFATSLSIRMTIPSGYTRECCYDFVSGAWVGPAVHYSDDPGRQGAAHTSWEVTFVRTSQSLAAIARSAGWARYPEASGRSRTVQHVLAANKLGTLKAFGVTDQQVAPDAKTQAALVIDLGQRVKAIVLFTLADPAADRDASGALTVNGLSSSAWNRSAAEAAMKSVQIEGALPISRVKAHASGRKVAGTVTDIAGQAVGQATVTLQRKAGGKWKKVRVGKSSLTGKFSLAAPGKGQYRVLAKIGGASARSGAVKVR